MRTGQETLVYDGDQISTVTSTKVENLEEGEYYQYRVAALNRVGEGPKSPLSEAFVSAQKPSKSAPP